MHQNTSDAINAVSLVHSYDGKKNAVDGMTFNVRRGEVFGVLGRNGAGKSTLIKVLTTLIRPTAGKLTILGMDPSHKSEEIRARIGVVQQDESFDFTSVEGNFDIYGVLWGIPKAVRIERRERLLKEFDLLEIRKKRSFDLSGGQKRRAQVAREFMHDMDILFLDEPTVGLDVIMRRNLLDLIKEQVKGGLTVVFTTHNLEEADYLCDRIAVVESGKVIALDTVENLKRLYGGKKTVEFAVEGSSGIELVRAVEQSLDGESTLKVLNDGTALVLTEDPKKALRVVVEASQKLGVQLEWLNVRKNTLEDVFLSSIGEQRSGN